MLVEKLDDIAIKTNLSEPCSCLLPGQLYTTCNVMGAKQSQDSTTSDLPPMAATTRREEGPVLFPSLFSPLVSNPPPSSSQGAAYPPGESANQGGRDLEVPPALPIRPFFAGQVPDEGESLTTGFSERGWDRHGHHHEATPPHGSHEDRPQHRHRSHHHHQNGSGHGRRAHRYLVEDRSNSEPVGMELDFSLAALNQRLRALQLRRETEESGSGSSSGGSRHRSHRSHSRNQYLSPGSFFFVRPVERSELACHGVGLGWWLVSPPLCGGSESKGQPVGMHRIPDDLEGVWTPEMKRGKV